MQKGSAKGLKPLIVQRLALLMGICYLMNPFHQEINLLVHKILHTLEIPDYVISHNPNPNHHHESYGHGDYHADAIDHDHLLVNLIDSIFKASEENKRAEDSLLTQIKIDKHISVYQFQLQVFFNTAIRQKFWLPQEKSESGYLKRLKEPPKYFYTKSI